MKTQRPSALPILPGEQIASIEEFEGGKNTYVNNGLVRSVCSGNQSL